MNLGARAMTSDFPGTTITGKIALWKSLTVPFLWVRVEQQSQWILLEL